jgi:peptidoglycan/LPS O-acetylase OafA/YrhL
MTGRTTSDSGALRKMGSAKMGYEPSLDGLRALSVIGVLLYHGGFSWMRGGFLGVEVFFVVSGYLITSLLIGEQEKTGRIDFKNFWIRRARRLLPAFFAMIVAVMIWAAFFGSEQDLSDLRRDVPWAVLYAGNWGQILGGVPYFGSDPLLKHVWSLAVEEQWYLLWPLGFVAIMKLRRGATTVGLFLVGAAFLVMAFTFWLESGSPSLLGGPIGLFEGLDRTNFMYLSTFTRSSGLLLGAGVAFFWRPWRSARAADAPVGRLLDPMGAAVVAALGCTFVAATLTAGYVYQWVLPLTSILSVIAVMIAMHPAAIGYRSALSWQPLVEVGKRSYGLYLWSWPIFVIVGALDGSVLKFVGAMLVSILVAEASYQLVETPIREGLLGRLWAGQRELVLRPMALGSVVLIGLGIFYVNVDQFNPFEGGEDAVFDASSLDIGAADGNTDAADVVDIAVVDSAVDGSAVTVTTVDGAADPIGAGVLATDSTITPPPATATATATTTATATLPVERKLAIVGDSQARALANNLPSGFEQVFPVIENGGLDGCSVWDSGKIVSERRFNNNFAICAGWQDKWSAAAAGAEVALVVIGAWDVFDVDDGDAYYAFNTQAADSKFAINLQSGIDALIATGADVAILEVPCMRPVSAEGSAVPPLPERGDDSRVAHVNDVIRWVSRQYGPEVRVLDGPGEWCNDEEIATNIGYRWDGVHVYQPGGKLIVEKIGAELVKLANRVP